MATPQAPSATSPGIQLGGIVDRPVDALTPWPGNPRKRSQRQIAVLASNIRQFGFTNPVIADECGTILSGHGRLQAARELGLASVPTRILSGLSESLKAAFAISDNKLGELSSWDDDLLRQQIDIVVQADLRIEMTGFSTAEIDLMYCPPDEKRGANPDDLQPADIPDRVVTRPGDLWNCGGHRLYCGSALEADSYAAVLQGEPAQLVFSDPPYNRASADIGGKGKTRHPDFAMAAGELSPQAFTGFLAKALGHAHASSRDGAIHYYCMDWRHQRELLDAAEPLFGPARQLCVWTKDSGGMGTFYRSQHELVFVFRKGAGPHINNFELGQHGRYRTNVWNYPSISNELLKLHPTVKPVSLVADALRDCSHRQGTVLDPFAGSGTVLVAAERTGRRARAIELDPHYVDVGIRRWQRVSGQRATLAATGQAWEDVGRERRAAPAEETDHGL